jgi:hypothetical protein
MKDASSHQDANDFEVLLYSVLDKAQCQQPFPEVPLMPMLLSYFFFIAVYSD